MGGPALSRVVVRVEPTPSTVDGLQLWFLHVHGGTPLGVGYPSGAPLRADGESHSAAWRRILREDACAYCGKPGGTVDHIVPRSVGGEHVHAWTNLVGACSRCNSSKGSLSLLDYLLLREARRERNLRRRDRRRAQRARGRAAVA